MSKRPMLVQFTLLAGLCLFGWPVFAGGDQEVFNKCMSEELEKVEDFRAHCENAASPDPGDPFAKVECLDRVKESIRAKAQVKCTELARGQMQADAAADPQPSVAATAGCVETATRKCPAKAAVPVPRAKPADLTRRAATPNKAAAAPAKTQPRTPTKTTTQTDRINRQAVTSARNTTPQGSGPAGNEANNDISMCDASYSAASRCCGNPTSCAGELHPQDQQSLAQLNSMMNQAPSSGGLSDYCQQMQNLGGSGSNVNVSLAGICNNKQMSCTMVCSDLADKYLALISNCNGCESQNIYQSAYQTLASRNAGCAQFASRVNQISNQAIGSSSAAGYGSVCNNVASANPQGGPGSNAPAAGAPKGNLDGGNDRFAQNCTVDPTTPACRALFKPATGAASFGAADAPEKKGKSKFDLPDDQSLTEKSFFSQATEPQAVKTKTIANNSGGGIPGAGNETSAKLGPDGKPQASPGAPGYTTDILQGTQGDAGYSAPVQDNGPGAVQAAAYFGGGRALASDNDNGGILGLDLRQFLPGGSRDPKRRLAGVGRRSEINAKEEDIWRIISSKMEEKCKLGILMDCRY